jgi:putative ABC transport system ATP-binding protein
MSGALVVDGVDLDLAGRRLLHGVSMTVPAGTVVAVTGASGSGKTTLLSVAGGLLEPTRGAATLDGRPTWTGEGDPRPDVALVLQVYGLVPILTALENVSVALRSRGVAPGPADEAAAHALARLHVDDLGHRQVEELSGGQMQRVAGARALVRESALLLADEPTSELDEVSRDLVMRELRREAERGAVVVVATHDPDVAAACDRRLVIDGGVLAGDGPEPVRGRHVATDRAG